MIALGLALLAAGGLPADRTRAPAGSDLTPVRSAELPPQLTWDTGLHLSWAHTPLRIAGAEGGDVVAGRWSGWLYGSVAPLDRLRFGFALPAVLSQRYDPAAAEAVSLTPLKRGLGDPRLEAAGNLLGDPRLALSALAALTLPASRPRLLAGEPTPTLTTELALSSRSGPLLLAANAGVLWRSREVLANTVLNDQLIFGAAATFEAGTRWRFAVAVDGAAAASRPWRLRGESPVELTSVAACALSWGLEVMAGGGMGLSGGLGSPDLRLLTGLRFAMSPPQPTPRYACARPPCDGDRIADIERLSVTFVQSARGDADGDGIENFADRCPVLPETVDGEDDADGCPETIRDSDGDAMLDSVDRCRLVPEDIDGLEDDDGCPDLDGWATDTSGP